MGSSKPLRKFTRISIKIVAAVVAGSKRMVGGVENISMHGLYLITDQKLPIGTEAEISIALDDQPENVLTVSAKVTRVTSYGIAFEFGKIDIDSYVHLKNLVALNIGDENQVNNEMESFITESK